jgi:hypothetical protein
MTNLRFLPVCDAESAVRSWINSRPDLYGPGHPIPKGAHLRRLRSPLKGAYLLVTTIGGSATGSPEAGTYTARISATAYGLTKEGASQAAVAYARAVGELAGVPVVMGPARCLYATAMTGPIDLVELDDSEPRYAVDADFTFG